MKLTDSEIKELLKYFPEYEENTIVGLYAFWTSYKGTDRNEAKLNGTFTKLLTIIASSPTLIDHLNGFTKDRVAGAKPPQILFGDVSAYIIGKNTIFINQFALGLGCGDITYKLIMSLAHEAAHSVSTIGQDKKDSKGFIDLAQTSLGEYVDLMNKIEGEAIYYLNGVMLPERPPGLPRN